MNSKEIITKAHGRVNLIGEHTDYNGGWVLPTAIPQSTTIRISARNNLNVYASAGKDPKTGALRQVNYRLQEEKPTHTWIDYVQGVTSVLQKEGYSLGGFQVEIESTVPEGSGLSSSAALEISLLKGVRELFSLPITDLQLARLGQRVENDFVGARVGIMDQMACTYAKSGEALFLDTFQMEFKNVKIPTDLVDLVVINSGVSHSLASGGGYNQRRSECEEACKILGIQHLRDISIDEISRIEELPPLLRKRAKHVVTENARVHLAVRALEQKRVSDLGELFNQSHASMKNDYEVSVSEIDQLVEICLKRPEVFGARLTGGGFGGSIVALTRAGKGNDVAQAIAEEYAAVVSKKATILVP